ncbi:DNA helicase IV [Salana multivorans]|uniref:DNA helicase IV n=1 Tax=Salana multivorans TaxID=120377 RepID=A0A3N2D269_9MICO|nr:UvrD-helicase domain-containing protein [Salana multivorans]OJX95618.1 MAG: AAA family ATPase [Micrococcales bacterium 73-15]ROR93857.1 DNA helicase IV [Salana multivorans]
MTDPEHDDTALGAQLALEQGVVDEVYGRLDDLRGQAASSLAQVRATRAEGTHQARSERDSFAAMYADRLATYDAVEHKLVFGRLDLAPGSTDAADGDDASRGPRYVGRVGLSDTEHTPILTDWRAPAARPFYQATAAHPAGVVRRRHLTTRDRRVVGIEDDVLDAEALDPEHRSSLAGEGALMAALGEHRTGRMQDIVATIQAEQDEIIRSDVEGVLVVQGGPGTGKTAVALHRAAYLLYAHRERMSRSGVLLVGPSDAFLRYIEKVLPALGETGVVSTTMSTLLPGITATGTESDAVARIKGRRGWGAIIARAVAARQRVPAEPVRFRLGSVDLEIRPDDVAAARTRARRAHQSHNAARVVFVRTMLQTLAKQYAQETGADLAAEDVAEVVEDLRSHRDVRVALNLAWFPLSAQGLVRDLLTKPHRLAEAAPGMSARDRHLLQRDADHPWTVADVPLLDEAWELIGDPIDPERQAAEVAAAQQAREELEYARSTLASYQPGGSGLPEVTAEQLASRMAESGPLMTTAERAAADRSWTYGHVVVDEAQELSPMAWRSLLRRCPSRSFTVVGDTGQTSSGAGARRWADVFDDLDRSWRLAQLTINYRTPRTVMDAATDVLHESLRREGLHPDVAPVTSARDVPGSLRIGRDLPSAVRESLELGGTTCVIAPIDQVDRLRAELDAPGVDLTRQLVVLDPVEAKGLEFDAVVAIDVAHLGPGDAYVAMTRTTRRLTLLGALPDGLDVRDLPHD